MKDNGNYIGLAPLMITCGRHRGILVRKIRFIENDESPAVNFLLTDKKEESLNIIMEYIADNKNKWDVMYL